VVLRDARARPGRRGRPSIRRFAFLFNSYYESGSARAWQRSAARAAQPAKPLARVQAYRREVGRRAVLHALLEHQLGALDDAARTRLELGLAHEEQHQELLLTDIKVVLGTQPLLPAYRAELARPVNAGERHPASRWRAFEGGVIEVGAPAAGFAFDNERPRHRALVPPFALATRPVCNREVLAFIADGGYRDPRHWLSDGWHAVQAQQWTAPMYWELSPGSDGGAQLYELAGVRPVDPDEPACHLSYYEADALARWAGARLPTEQEWELAAAALAPDRGNFADDDRLHPAAAAPGADPGELAQLFGDVWEWTSSSYSPYPGFRTLGGALGEYNGKFMSGQQVLRGGSCLTPRGHVRASYRNFFPPAARWQMTGVRLARDLEIR
jgi:ergothioneine biosynthesis protein EgtB